MTRIMDSNSPELNASSVSAASTINSGAAAAQLPEPNATQRPTEAKRQNSKKTMERERPLDDIISEQFPSFDADSLIVRPFKDDAAQHANFEKELSNLLLDVIIETHAWASARPRHQAAMEGQKLEEKLSHIIAIEREQEQTREKLGAFVRCMKTAVAALAEPF